MSRIHQIFKKVICLTLALTLLCTSMVFEASASQSGTITADEVNLRKEPNTDCTIYDVLNTGDTVEVLDTSIDGWVKVSYTSRHDGDLVGYVSASYIELGIETSDTPETNAAGVTQTATISESGVRMRMEPDTASAILALVEPGTVVTILDESIEGWIKARYTDGDNTYTGFIAADYLYTNPMATGITDRSSVIMRENADAMPIYDIDDFKEAVQKAYEIAEPGDIVILSPASAAFDKFKNFMVRGKFFKEIVNNLE